VQTYDPIYKRDTRGNLRVWYMEREAERYRTVAGIHGGALVTSEWTTAQATNVGRANERMPGDQAIFEVEAAYTHKLTREYHRTIEATEGGAHFFKPMLAKEFEAAKFAGGYAQPKLDGMRCIATADGLWSRQGKPITSCAHIEAALKPLFDADPELILDGELYNHDLKADFGKLMSMVKKATPTAAQATEIAANVQYHVYDIPSSDLPFGDRLIALVAKLASQQMLKREEDGTITFSGPIHLVPTKKIENPEVFDHHHATWLQAGYEGSMWRAHAPYEQKRSKNLCKRKDFDDAEFDVVAIEEGEGNWAGAAKRVVCWLPDADRTGGPTKSNTFEAGIRGTYERGVELLAEDHKVVTVRHFGWTDTAIPKPRFGVVTKFHGAARTL